MKRSWWLSVVGIVAIATCIRVFQIMQSPPSPYWEEVALGYDAYSILQTGKDHHGNAWPVVAFESFGDWKPSGYFYALVPFIWAFGLNVWSVRLLSVVAGVGIVAGMGVLTWLFLGKNLKEVERKTAMLFVLFVATLLPWLIQFSRGGWEANLATCFIVWGVVFGLKSLQISKNTRRFWWLMGSAVLLVASMYTYHSARMLAPTLGLVLGWQFIARDVREKHILWVRYVVVGLLVTGLLFPFAKALGTPALGQRLAETSIFSDLSVIERSNQLQATHGFSLFSKLAYHRYALFAGVIAEQFLSHFQLDFLFVSGDINPRHSAGYFGLLYPFEIAFLFVGLTWIIRSFSKEHRWLLAVWLFFGILPSALTTAVPHALRILPTAPLFILATGLGVWQASLWLIQTAKRWKFLALLPQKTWPLPLLGVYLFFFAGFYRYLLTVYPQRTAPEWQYGYQEMVHAVETLQQSHPDLPVYITREYGRPAMYYWFFTQTDPQRVQQANALAAKDQGEFLEFENIRFVQNLSGVVGPAIVAGKPGQLSLVDSQTVLDPAGNTVWEIGQVE